MPPKLAGLKFAEAGPELEFVVSLKSPPMKNWKDWPPEPVKIKLSLPHIDTDEATPVKLLDKIAVGAELTEILTVLLKIVHVTVFKVFLTSLHILRLESTGW